MKQVLRFSIMLLVLLLPATATAYDFEVDGIYYNINGNEATVTDGGSYSNRYSGSVAIPATVTYNGTTYSVTSIGESAFSWCMGLTSIDIPNLVTSIGESAFEYCFGLTDVYCYIADPSRVSSGDKQFSLGYGDCSGRTLHVLQGTADAYRADENWYPYFGQIVDDLKPNVYGDVNGDFEVNIADVNAAIDVILGGSGNTAADVNSDGEINIADINAVIDIILGGTRN